MAQPQPTLFSARAGDLMGCSPVSHAPLPFTGDDPQQVITCADRFLRGLAFATVGVASTKRRELWGAFLNLVATKGEAASFGAKVISIHLMADIVIPAFEAVAWQLSSLRPRYRQDRS